MTAPSQVAGITTVSDGVQSLIASGQMKGPFAVHLQRAARRWEGIVGRVPIDQIDRAMILEFGQKLLDGGFALATARNYIYQITTIIKRSGGPWLSMSTVRAHRQTPTHAELSRLWDATRAMTWPFVPSSESDVCWFGIPPAIWWRAFLMIAFSTGLRKADLLCLRWDQVSSDRILVDTGTDSKSVGVPIADALVPWLRVLKIGNSKTVLGVETDCHFDRVLLSIASHANCRPINFKALELAAAAAFEKARPGAGEIIRTLNTSVPKEISAARFQLLRSASKRLTYPDGFLDPPPACFHEPLSNLRSEPTPPPSIRQRVWPARRRGRRSSRRR